MKRRSLAMGAMVITAAAFGAWLLAQPADTRELPTLLPPNAILYLEARNFHSLLGQWNNSPEKSRWLASGNHAVMSQSRLIQRLGEAQAEFVSVAGISVGMNLLDEVAGARSAIAFYDVSFNLSFVYLTELPSSGVEATSLWRSRGSYQPREVAGIPFYVKRRATNNGTRTVAFAAYNGWMVLATDEARMAETLGLLSGRPARSLSVEPWFAQAHKEQANDGDLRLLYNLRALIATPQFRTYWIQRNASELKPFEAGVSELYQRPSGFEEQRVLLRNTPVPIATDATSLSEALRYAPRESSLYRAWAAPDSDRIRESVERVFFAEHVAMRALDAPAPTVQTEAGAVGTESDLEIRIDEPPFEREQGPSIEPVLKAVEAMHPAALLDVEMTTLLEDRVFVLPHRGVVIICKDPDRAALDGALAQVDLRTQNGALDPVTAQIEGNAVVISRIPLTRQAATDPVAADTTQIEVYNHGFEWPRYKKLFAAIDAPNPPSASSAAAPTFFVGNLGSLGDVNTRLERVSITTADRGAKVSELVQYQLGPAQ